MKLAAQFALLSSGGFLLTGLLTGVWKYRHVFTSTDGTAPTYVNIAHRAALLYAFASLVMFELVLRSPFSQSVELLAVAGPVAFFTFATASYVLMGVSRVTDNQFRNPRDPTALRAGMWALIIAEVGGIGLLTAGFVSTSVTGTTLVTFSLTVAFGILALLAVLRWQGVLSHVLKSAVED